MATKEEVHRRHGVTTVSELPPETAMIGGDAAGVGTVSAPAPMPRVAPHDALRNAAHNWDVARYEARQRRAAVSAARENFNLALRGWNASGSAPQNQAELMKEHIASNQRERERKAAQGLLRRPASVSEMARAIGIGGHRAQRGGGVSYRRGAYSKAQALEINAEKLRAAAVARKLPS